MTDKEVFQLIFLPGFSTKESVTEFSGRGVGMDVVAQNIESIGGTVSVDSIAGSGTTMMIKIPLTLANHRRHEYQGGSIQLYAADCDD